MKDNLAIIGMQWGDEGKGKIVDLLAPKFDIVTRFQGGNNAGHTIKVKGETVILHTVPSGALHPGVMNVIGNGVVVNPPALIKEIELLADFGINLENRLYISDRCHLTLPLHLARDKGSEQKRGSKKIGTTSKGIGPTYGDKIMRRGIRAGDLISEDYKKIITPNIEANLDRIQRLYKAEVPSLDEIIKEIETWRKRLNPFIADTGLYLNESMDDGKKILFEGAQGTMLDVDHGTYPYVTSSSSTTGGIPIGTGIAPKKIGKILGIVKAYTTRVGSGPFPTELSCDDGEKLRKMGSEFGATTGRPRRCGWFDLVVARYSIRLNGVDFIALTKLDVLDTFEEIKVCTGYRTGNEVLENFPADISKLESVEPVYEIFPGWMESTAGTSGFNDLPENARKYVKTLEKLMNCPIAVISTGAARSEHIFCENSYFSEI